MELISRIVELTETSDLFHSLAGTEEGSKTLEEVDLTYLYQVNTRVVVMVRELQTVFIHYLIHFREAM